MNLEDNERKFYRQILGWILLIPAVSVSSWLLALYSPAVALTVFVVLPFSGMVLYPWAADRTVRGLDPVPGSHRVPS